MTAEERATPIASEYGHQTEEFTDLRDRIVAAIREAETAMKERCARLVEAGGDDGVDRLEIAIQLGPNAAIAAAIRALE